MDYDFEDSTGFSGGSLEILDIDDLGFDDLGADDQSDVEQGGADLDDVEQGGTDLDDVGQGDAAQPSKGRKKRNAPKIRNGLWIHFTILGLVVLIAAIAGWRLFNWSKGVHVEPDADADLKYNIEVNDNMVLLAPSKLEGREDDGVTTVLCLGNAPFSDDRGEAGLAGQIAALSGANVINASFPGSQVTCLNPSYDTSTIEGMNDIFNLFYVVYSMTLGNYDAMETVATLHADDERFAASIDALKNTDFDSVDIIAVMYDATDYVNGMPVINMNNREELTTYSGSLLNSFRLIQETWPHIRVVFMSPTYMTFLNEEGEALDGRTTDIGNGTLIQYWQFAFDTCGSASVSFLDNYYGSVNDSNYGQYLLDNIHLNEAGRTKVADHFVYKVIENNYAEYNADSLSVAR